MKSTGLVTGAKKSPKCTSMRLGRGPGSGTYLGYELSPKPKVVNLRALRHPGTSFLLKRLFQKSRQFWGISPWPVVDRTKMVRVWRIASLFYFLSQREYSHSRNALRRSQIGFKQRTEGCRKIGEDGIKLTSLTASISSSTVLKCRRLSILPSSSAMSWLFPVSEPYKTKIDLPGTSATSTGVSGSTDVIPSQSRRTFAQCKRMSWLEKCFPEAHVLPVCKEKGRCYGLMSDECDVATQRHKAEERTGSIHVRVYNRQINR